MRWARKDLPEQLRDRLRRAVRDGDLAGLHPALQEPADLLGDQLQLGAFAPALQQPQRLSGGHGRGGVGLEDVALQMVQRRRGGGRVVLGAGRQGEMLGGERQQPLEGVAAAGERGAAGLVGERDRDAVPPPRRPASRSRRAAAA